jgi:hypothetical protein
MRKLKEVLRLYSLGLKQQQIARRLLLDAVAQCPDPADQKSVRVGSVSRYIPLRCSLLSPPRLAFGVR